MDISTQSRIAEIHHPTFPELIVDVRKLNRLKQHRIGNIFNRMSRFVPVADPTSGGFLMKKNPDGTAGYVTERVPDIPVESALEALEVYVVNIRGLTIDGEEVRYSSNGAGSPEKRRAALEALLDDALDVEIEVMKDGQTVKQKQSFLDYLVTKASDPATFGDASGKV